MVKHSLFLVHGMGRHEGTEWSDEIWAKLVECSQRYAFFESESLDDLARPVPIEYDHLIRSALERWSESAGSFGAFAQTNELRHADALDWLEGIDAEDAGFQMSHVADVVVYRFFKLEQGRIQDFVKAALAREIANQRDLDGSAQFSLMAHSLGTSVAHDALAELGGAAELDGTVNALSAQNFHFASIHMLANVSRMLETEPGAYDSVVRPGHHDDPASYCLRMYSHRHELDPFTRPKCFAPRNWGTAYTARELEHYRGWNVHGWLHYLDHPLVHIPILKSITRSTAIGKRARRKAVEAYEQFGGDLANVDVARDKIEELKAQMQLLDSDAGLKENFARLKELWGGISDLKGLVDDTWKKLEGSVA